MIRYLYVWLVPIFGMAIALPVYAEPAKPLLTLDAAIERAITNSPRLKSANSAITMNKGEQLQAGLMPNPEVGIEAENISGGGRYSGVDSGEFTYGVSQTIEIGGKRSNRVAVADKGLLLSQHDYEVERLKLIRDVTIAYSEAIAAGEELALASDQKKVADDLLKEVKSRVSAAREPLVQQSKTEISVATSAFAEERAEREFNRSIHVLANLLGEHNKNFSLDKNAFFTLIPPMNEAQVEGALEKNPNIRKWKTERERNEAIYNLERSQAIPDPRISLGVRDFRDSGDQALVAGVSIPIPVWNRNQGNIAKARQAIAKSESDKDTATLDVMTETFQSLQDMTNGYRKAESLKKDIIPAAEKSFKLARQGYSLGRFAYLEVLDSQRTLFDAKAQYIGALRDYNKSRAEVERLTGKYFKEASHEK